MTVAVSVIINLECTCYIYVAEEVCKKGVLKDFTKFLGKHLWQSLFFNKIAVLRPVTLLKKKLWHMCFPVSVMKFLRTYLHICDLVLILPEAAKFCNIYRKTPVLKSLFKLQLY